MKEAIALPFFMENKMRLKTLIFTLLFLSPLTALGQVSTSTSTGTATSTATAGATTINVGGGMSTPSNTTASGGTANGGTSNQHQNASGGNSSNSYYSAAQRRNPVATAWAAPLTAADDTCMGSTTAGGQGLSFGLAFGSTWRDEDCIRRKDARELHNMGYKAAAISLLCQSEGVAEAMKTAGTPCRDIGKKPIKTTKEANHQEYQEIHKPIDRN